MTPMPALAAKESPVESTVPLLPARRRQVIVDFLRRHGAVTLQQLSQALHVSLSTLRRDLDALAAAGEVDRTHGGALLRSQHYSTFEPDARAASELSPAEKQAIGIAAAAALEPHQSVIMDSGSTVAEAARAVLARKIPLVVATNDLAIAQMMAASSLIQLHVLGGTLRAGSNTLIGQAVLDAARTIHADVLLFGAHAVTDGFVSETSPEVTAVKRALMQAAQSTWLLVDGSKFRPRAFSLICEIDDIDGVFTDDGAPPDALQHLREHGVRVTIAGKS